MNDLHDLFTLDDSDERSTETGRMFSGTEKRLESGRDAATTSSQAGASAKSSDQPITSKRRTKKTENNDDDFIMVAKMNGVSGLEDFHTGEDQNTSTTASENINTNPDGDDPESLDNDRFMEGLFANSGVYSTLKHDSIMSGSQPDQLLIEREAARVAKQAAAALKASSRVTRKAEIGTPTWTGRFGSAGILKSRSGNNTTRASATSANGSSSKFL